MSLYKNASFKAITQGQFNKIEGKAVHYDWNLAFDGKSRGNQHLARTVRLVGYLWEQVHGPVDNVKETETLIELDIAIAGALLHDIGLVNGNPGHCFTGKIIAGPILKDIGVSKEHIGQILHCIEAHDGEVPAKTQEAMFVHDADTIDKLGPLGAIRHIWKLSLMEKEEFDVDKLLKKVPEHLESRFNTLYLIQSKALGSKLKPYQKKMFEDTEVFNKLVNFIYTSSEGGIPVDIMLESLIKNIDFEPEIVNSIKKQVELKIIDF